MKTRHRSQRHLASGCAVSRIFVSVRSESTNRPGAFVMPAPERHPRLWRYRQRVDDDLLEGELVEFLFEMFHFCTVI